MCTLFFVTQSGTDNTINNLHKIETINGGRDSIYII